MCLPLPVQPEDNPRGVCRKEYSSDYSRENGGLTVVTAAVVVWGSSGGGEGCVRSVSRSHGLAGWGKRWQATAVTAGPRYSVVYRSLNSTNVD